jgi:queuosine biosynthesis protein QueC
VTNTRQQGAQRAQLNRLRSKTSAHICHVAIPYGLHWAGINAEGKEESSQRTRGFLFLTLGAVSAIAAGTKELFLYENGVGTINLPYDGTQVGTYNSRATHPSTLLRMQDFIKALTGQEFSIVNPFLFFTKAEMCRHVAVQELGELLALTFSCDGFSVRAKKRGQCGSCTSCLLRRQAIEFAGLSRYDQNGYLNDLASPPFAGSDNQLHDLRAMNWQAHRIREAVSRANPWEALVSEFIELQKVELDLNSVGVFQRAKSSACIVSFIPQSGDPSIRLATRFPSLGLASLHSASRSATIRTIVSCRGTWPNRVQPRFSCQQITVCHRIGVALSLALRQGNATSSARWRIACGSSERTWLDMLAVWSPTDHPRSSIPKALWFGRRGRCAKIS